MGRPKRDRSGAGGHGLGRVPGADGASQGALVIDEDGDVANGEIGVVSFEVQDGD